MMSRQSDRCYIASQAQHGGCESLVWYSMPCAATLWCQQLAVEHKSVSTVEFDTKNSRHPMNIIL